MRLLGRLLPLTVAAFASACAGQREADAAFRDAEQAITDQHTQAIRYAPRVFERVMAVYDTARLRYAQGDYGAAIAGARKAIELTEDSLRPAIGVGRKRIENEWLAVRDSLNTLLNALERRVEELHGTRRLPAAVAAADLDSARAQLPILVESFAEADKMFRNGQSMQAMHVVSQVHAQAIGLSNVLGPVTSRGSVP